MLIKKVVITGTTGAIGVTLVNTLTSEGIKCVVINVPSFVDKKVFLKSEMITFLDGGIDDYKTLMHNANLPLDCDAFIHLAWAGGFGSERDETSIQARNVTGTLDAIELAKYMGCKVFLGAGSQAEYGKGVENDVRDISPVSGYGIAKLSAGLLGKLKASQLGIRFNWVRIFSVFGPNQNPGAIIPYIISSLINGDSPKLTPCEQIWDFLYTEDAVQGLIAIMNHGIHGKTYELGSGQPGTIRSFIERIRAVLKTNTPIEYGAIPYPKNQIMKMCANIEPLKKDTGWTPFHSFEEGIIIVAEYLMNNNK